MYHIISFPKIEKAFIKNIIILSLTSFILLMSPMLTAQGVGIGTVTPDASSALQVSAYDKGFLMPRLTTGQRDSIILPATGLMIYNLTLSDAQLNTGTPEIPDWIGTKGNADSTIIDTIVTSVTATGDISTFSRIDTIIPGISLSPPSGTYLILFNGQYGLKESEPVNTAQGVIDLTAAYDSLMAIPVTVTDHGPIFGNGEVLLPGVYDLPAAVSLAGTLTMDGGGDTNSVFIMRIGGAYTTGAISTVVLTNGAKARNIFWVAEGAMALAATTIMKGTMIAHAGAVSMAAGSNLEGRMFSIAGAISMGPGTAAIPAGTSYIDLGVLSTFVIFTSVGAIANTNPSNITGDVGTNAGAIAGFDDIDGNVYAPGLAPEPTNNSLVTFSLYQYGVQVENSSRTIDVNTGTVSLQATATLTSGQPIEVRWRVDTGGVILGNRILSSIRMTH